MHEKRLVEVNDCLLNSGVVSIMLRSQLDYGLQDSLKEYSCFDTPAFSQKNDCYNFRLFVLQLTVLFIFVDKKILHLFSWQNCKMIYCKVNIYSVKPTKIWPIFHNSKPLKNYLF